MTNNSQQTTVHLKDVKAIGKKKYHTPVVQRYGSISELVKHGPGIGRDGGPTDCNRS